MASWTVKGDEDELIIETTRDDKVRMGSVSGEPILLSRPEAEAARTALGSAIVTLPSDQS